MPTVRALETCRSPSFSEEARQGAGGGQVARVRAVSRSSRAWARPLAESGSPESSLAISAMRSSPLSCCTLLAVTAPVAVLHHLQVVGGERGDLGEVGDHDHLRRLGQPCQPPADLDGGGAADSGIDLVEHEGGHRVAGGDDDLDGEHDPGQLAAGGAAASGRGSAPGCGCSRIVTWSRPDWRVVVALRKSPRSGARRAWPAPPVPR